MKGRRQRRQKVDLTNAPFWGDVVDPERYLYHYTTRQAVLGSILPTGQVRFGLFRYTNDPRESKDWFFSLTRDDPDEQANAADDFDAINRDANRIAKRTCKLLCLTRDDPAATTIFGRGFAHSRMWAQYGGGHSGVCLIFDREHLAADIEATLGGKGDLWSDPVLYYDEAADEINAFGLRSLKIHQLGLEHAVAEHIRAHRQPLFFRKNRDWAGELEYRWILQSPEPAPEFVTIGASLIGIVLGHDFPSEDRDSLLHFLTIFGNPALAQAKWNNGSFNLAPDEGLNPRISFWPAGSPWADGSAGSSPGS
jgi:hypothetical protein